jgi:hypothetical protein
MFIVGGAPAGQARSRGRVRAFGHTARPRAVWATRCRSTWSSAATSIRGSRSGRTQRSRMRSATKLEHRPPRPAERCSRGAPRRRRVHPDRRRADLLCARDWLRSTSMDSWSPARMYGARASPSGHSAGAALPRVEPARRVFAGDVRYGSVKRVASAVGEGAMAAQPFTATSRGSR